MGRPNIVFILIDTLRAKNVSCYGYPINTTPNIDKIANNGVLFENAFACINATDPSVTSIFSGLLPVSHGLINHGTNVKKSDIIQLKYIPWLPEVLKKYGYQTVAIDWLGRWHRRGFDLYLGFDKYEYFNVSNNIKILLNSLVEKLKNSTLKYFSKKNKKYKKIDNAKEITTKAIKLIENMKKEPFFLFIHYWDAHAPYNSFDKSLFNLKIYEKIYYSIDIKNAEKIFKNNNVSGPIIKFIKENGGILECIAKYDNSIKYVDKEIERLFSYLKTTGKLNNTLIIITSDHGESLIEHGILFDHHGLYEPNIRVPLIMYYKKFSRKRIKTLVQHIDILPTILEICNIDYQPSFFDGKSLLPIINGKLEKIRDFILIEEAHTQRRIGIRTSKFKYIYSPNEEEKCRYCKVIHGSRNELYNLNIDPEERNNIATKHPELVIYFRKFLLHERIKYKSKAKNIMKIKKLRRKFKK